MKTPNRFLTYLNKRPQISLLVLALILLSGIALAFWQGQNEALDSLESTLDRASANRKHFFQLNFQSPLLVPDVLVSSLAVRALLAGPSAEAVRLQNIVLEETAHNTQIEVLYVMDLNGDTLAASNWRASDSFVGKNYRFRPYFQQALSNQTGRYIAKGVTSGKIGYYLARAVTVEGDVRGAVVAKNSLDDLQNELDAFWRDNKELDLLSDLNGVLVAAPVSDMVFKSIEPMTEVARRTVEASRQYGDKINTLPMTQVKVLSDTIRVVEFAALPGQTFLQKSYVFPDLGMRLYLHLPVSRYWKIVSEFTAMFSLVSLAIFLVCVGLFQRWSFTAKLIETAIRDPLTGLHTRLYMVDWCEATIRVHNRDPGAGFALVIFDLDFFKQVNDQHGHLAGDEVLRRVGEIIRNSIRGDDLAVRFGGEELALFVRCTELAQALALAERVRLSVERFEFRGQSGRFLVTVSGGIAYHAAGETLDALFARADKKLYEAKEQGRNRIIN